MELDAETLLELSGIGEVPVWEFSLSRILKNRPKTLLQKRDNRDNMKEYRLRKGCKPQTRVAYAGEMLSYQAVARKNGISDNTYQKRVERGWDKLKAATTPLKGSK